MWGPRPDAWARGGGAGRGSGPLDRPLPLGNTPGMTITGRRLREAAARAARPGGGRSALVGFGALAAVDLYATAKAPRGWSRAAKPLLMPALAAHVVRGRTEAAQPVPKALLIGLACATAGDTALLCDDRGRREPAFLTGMAAFLGTQLAYTAGMAGRLGAVAGLRARPRRAAAVLGGWAAANAVLAPALERRLRLPVAGYSLALAAMGAAALGVGGKVAAGAVAFTVSDLLIGLQAGGRELPGQEVLIMAGYLLGQYLITAGWLERIPS